MEVRREFGKKDSLNLDGFKEPGSDNSKVLRHLKHFCVRNNFNMFDPSFDNCYGGQEWHVKEKLQFNKLREKRINKFKKRLKDE